MLKNLTIRTTLGLSLLLGGASTTLAGVAVPEAYTTDFEDIGGFVFSGGAITEFSVGPARFTGGMSGVAGIGDLYRSGTHAWMVKGGETGVIDFEPGHYQVSFYAKAFSGSDGDTVISAFDTADNLLASLTLSAANPFTPFSVMGPLSRIEVFNGDSSNSRMNALDDFSVAPVPVPAAFWLFGSALLGATGLRHRSAASGRGNSVPG